jgi:hypothetical protein
LALTAASSAPRCGEWPWTYRCFHMRAGMMPGLMLCLRLSAAAARAFHVTKSVGALACFAAGDPLPLCLLGITRSYREGADVMKTWSRYIAFGAELNRCLNVRRFAQHPSWPLHRDRPFFIGASPDQQPTPRCRRSPSNGRRLAPDAPSRPTSGKQHSIFRWNPDGV